MNKTSLAADNRIIVRGGGDIATGTIARLHLCGYRVLVLETEKPSAIRRTVSVCEAVYDNLVRVENVQAQQVFSLEQCHAVWADNRVAVLVDPSGESISSLQPLAVVDAILAKKNCGTRMNMAPVTIGLGPGFEAGSDVHGVIETARGHNLGRVIYKGRALANTGVPGEIGGYSSQRVIYAPAEGSLRVVADIGSQVEQGEIIAWIDDHPVAATIGGLVRGMIRDQFQVYPGLKIADIDPRSGELQNCWTISDKARCISGGVLEAILVLCRAPDTIFC